MQTIIECLKYATTGELPPNTKGGAFVHDPKMAGEKEVKAQVRLRFWNVKREKMVVNRNLQVTVKKTGGMTMKTLEGMLSKVDTPDGDARVCQCLPYPVQSTADHSSTLLAECDLNQMCRDGYRSTTTHGSVESDLGERHFLSSRRVELATCGGCRIEKEV